MNFLASSLTVYGLIITVSPPGVSGLNTTMVRPDSVSNIIDSTSSCISLPKGCFQHTFASYFAVSIMTGPSRCSSHTLLLPTFLSDSGFSPIEGRQLDGLYRTSEKDSTGPNIPSRLATTFVTTCQKNETWHQWRLTNFLVIHYSHGIQRSLLEEAFNVSFRPFGLWHQARRFSGHPLGRRSHCKNSKWWIMFGIFVSNEKAEKFCSLFLLLQFSLVESRYILAISGLAGALLGFAGLKTRMLVFALLFYG